MILYAWLLVSKRASLQSAHPMQLLKIIPPLLRKMQQVVMPGPKHKQTFQNAVKAAVDQDF